MRKLGLLALCSALAVSIAALLLPSTAGASFHLTKISEIYATADSQFIELQFYSGGQNFVNGVSVTVHDSTGATIETITFSSNVPVGQSQRHILLATAGADLQFDVTPDFVMDPVIDPAGGKVCFSSIDCVAWGNYTGPAGTGGTVVGTPFDAANGLPPSMSIARDVSGGANPTQLEGSDDTNDSAADFDAAAPTPTNNAGQTAGGGPSPSPSPSQTPVGDPPPPVTTITKPEHGATYRLGKLRTFSGTAVSEADGQIDIELAIRKRMKGGTCKWWKPSLVGFVKGSCSDKRFFLATDGESWSYELHCHLGEASIGTRVRDYTAYSRGSCACSPFQEALFEPGRNANRFELKGTAPRCK